MPKILNVGSINIDHVYAVPHFVQAGETLSAADLHRFPGGKGMNQSIALVNAGAEVFHAGKVGADGLELVELLRESGVDAARIGTDGSTTGHAIIQVIPDGQNCILLYPGANRELDEALLERAFDGFGEGDVLVLQNEVNQIALAMRLGYERGMRIAFNPSPFGPEIFQYPLELVRWFLLNEIEGRAFTEYSAPKQIIGAIRSRYPDSAVVLTLGRDGVKYADQAQTLSHGTYRTPVVDTTAAGDTFTGFFISSATAGLPPEEALRRASLASAIAISRPGAAVSIPTLSETLLSNLEANR